MRRKIILIAVLVLLMLFAVAPLISLPVNAEGNAKADARTTSLPASPGYQSKYASQFWFGGGELYNSPTWPNQGILYSNDYPVDSYAYYQFTMPGPASSISGLDVGVYGKAVSGNGVDVYVWNWATSADEYVFTTGTGQGLYVHGVSPTNHIGGANEYRLKVVADDTSSVDDKYDMWYIDTGYSWTGYKVTSPNGGESWAMGTTHTISWTSEGSPGATVYVDLLKSGSLVWWTTHSNVAGSNSYSWTIPTTLTPGSDYKIRIMSTTTGIYDLSDGFFTITGGKVDTVLNFGFTPNPASPGTTVTLSGTLKTTGGTAVYPASVTVDYSTDGGATWHYAWTLSTNAAGQFSKSFTAPGAGTYKVRVSYAGSATYNPSSHTETLTVTAVWGDYHFRISPYTDLIHIKISGGVIYGVSDAPGAYSNAPLLGYIQGSTFYFFIDVPDGMYSSELMMFVGSTSTLSGVWYWTEDGKSWSPGTSFTLVPASSASGSSAMGQASASAAKPQSWPATYHFRLSPWIDIVRLSVDGSVIHGTDEAPGYYYDQPVLGYVSGSFFILGIDTTAAGQIYELSIIRASTSTMSGYAYQTTNGKSLTSGPTITFVSVPP